MTCFEGTEKHANLCKVISKVKHIHVQDTIYSRNVPKLPSSIDPLTDTEVFWVSTSLCPDDCHLIIEPLGWSENEWTLYVKF